MTCKEQVVCFSHAPKIRDLNTTYIVEGPSTICNATSVIEEEISIILEVFELSDQNPEAKDNCASRALRYEHTISRQKILYLMYKMRIQ